MWNEDLKPRPKPIRLLKPVPNRETPMALQEEREREIHINYMVETYEVYNIQKNIPRVRG